jgi:hypothetical protein
MTVHAQFGMTMTAAATTSKQVASVVLRLSAALLSLCVATASPVVGPPILTEYARTQFALAMTAATIASKRVSGKRSALS